MRFNSVGFALSVGMALIVVLFAFTLLSAAGLAGFSAADVAAATQAPAVPVDSIARPATAQPVRTAAEAKAIAVGQTLFVNNCAQCHAINEVVVGPALAGITKRRPVSWLIPWVKNSSKIVASGDDYAVAVFNKFNKQQMPSFALSDEEITSVLAYVNWEEEHRGVPTADAVVIRTVNY